MGLLTASAAAPLVSVIVPSYNSRITLPRCLDSLCAQQCDADYEILVVDSSDDGAAELVAQRYPQVRLLRYSEKTLPGKGRNRGVREARGEILVFTDADCVAPRDWISRHLSRQRDWDIVGGALDNGNPRSLIGWAGYLSEFNGYTPGHRCIPQRNLATANVSYKAKVFAHDRFPEDIWPGEDRIVQETVSAKYSCCLDTSLTVRHLNRSQFREFLDHQLRLGASSAAARKRIALPGAFLLRYPAMVFLVPFYRTAMLFARVFRDTPRFLFPALLIAPLAFSGYFAWSMAFYQECRR